MTEVVERTACGLWVLPGRAPREWPNFSWEIEVADVDGDRGQQEELDALSLVQEQLRRQLGRDAAGFAVAPADVAFAALHVGRVPRVADHRLDVADRFTSVADVEAWREPLRLRLPFTVCGVLEESWRAVCWAVEAVSGLHAAFEAWEALRDETGEFLLVAAVHRETVAAVEVFGLADPWAADPEQIIEKATTEWGVRR